MSMFENNKKHNDKFLNEIRNRIMMKFLSVIPTGLSTAYPHNTCTTVGWLLIMTTVARGCATTVGWLLIMTTVARGCATTVGWLLIMTTVGKTHAIKYTKEATLTKPIHY